MDESGAEMGTLARPLEPGEAERPAGGQGGDRPHRARPLLLAGPHPAPARGRGRRRSAAPTSASTRSPPAVPGALRARSLPGGWSGRSRSSSCGRWSTGSGSGWWTRPTAGSGSTRRRTWSAPGPCVAAGRGERGVTHGEAGKEDQVHVRDRRRGQLAGQGAGRGVDRRAAREPRARGHAPQARPLHQRRPGHDEPVPARRGLRHRRRRRDRPRPRPLRALHHRQDDPQEQLHHRAHLPERSSTRSGAASTWARPCR